MLTAMIYVLCPTRPPYEKRLATTVTASVPHLLVVSISLSMGTLFVSLGEV